MYVVAWLAILLQPCAVAGEADHDCPHCPPEMHQEAPRAAISADADCVIGDQVNVEARSPQIKLNDAPGKVPLAIVPESSDPGMRHVAGQQLDETPLRLNPGGPPLNVLNCVYLK